MIFASEDRERACLAALGAAARGRGAAAALNRNRAAAGLPTAEIYLALHVGEVFYGNVGSKDRLDFTVVGPAVNEVSRILAMSRSVEQDVLLSAGFAAALDDKTRLRLVSVGRYALRGVAQPEDCSSPNPVSMGREPCCKSRRRPRYSRIGGRRVRRLAVLFIVGMSVRKS